MHTAHFKVTTCYKQYSSQRPSRYTTMKVSTNTVWIRAELQACIKPPPIPLINSVTEDVNGCDIFNTKMRHNQSEAYSETYNINIATFEKVQLE